MWVEGEDGAGQEELAPPPYLANEWRSDQLHDSDGEGGGSSRDGDGELRGVSEDLSSSS